MAPLKIPAALYGTQKDVAAHARVMVKRIGKGETLTAVVGNDLVDPTTVPGLVLTRRSSVLSGVPNVHIYEPCEQLGRAVLDKRLPDELMDRVFLEALATPWGLLSLIGQANQFWFYPVARHLPFWERALDWWPLLDAIGPRYTFGVSWGQNLWSVPNNLHYVAVHLGVPIDDVKKPLPPGGLAALDALRVRRPSGTN